MTAAVAHLAGLRRRDGAPVAADSSLARAVLRRPTARVGLALLAALLLFVALTPLLRHRDPYAEDGAQLQGPTIEHPFGTDQLGRDVLVRVADGGRRTLGGASAALGVAVVAGIAVGATGVVAGRRTDAVLLRAVDALNGLPSLVVPVALVGALGASYANLLLAIVIGYVPSYARIARTFGETLRNRLDVVSARLLGVSRRRIVVTHVVPAVLAQMVVIATLDIGSVIVSLSGLSFLGLGAQAPTPEWGVLLDDGQMFFAVAPWLLVFPALAVSAVIIGSNLLGEALRDARAEQRGR